MPLASGSDGLDELAGMQALSEEYESRIKKLKQALAAMPNGVRFS